VWAMLPSFDQRTVSPTEIDRATGLKKPTHGLGWPSHWLRLPIETKWVVVASVVLVDVVVVLELEEVVVDADGVVVVDVVEGLVVVGARAEVVVVAATVVEVVDEVVPAIRGAGGGIVLPGVVVV